MLDDQICGRDPRQNRLKEGRRGFEHGSSTSHRKGQFRPNCGAEFSLVQPCICVDFCFESPHSLIHEVTGYTSINKTH